MRIVVVTATLLAALLHLFVPPASAAPEAGAVIDAVIQFYGGRDTLAATVSVRTEGTLSASDGRDAPFTRLFQRPGSLLVDIRYPDQPEKRLLAGGQGWRTRRGGVMAPVEGFLLDSMLLQAARSDLPWILEINRDRITAAQRLEAGKTVVVLEMELKPGLTFRAIVDPGSSLVTSTEGLLAAGPAGTTVFLTQYSDFRRVEGVLMPFFEVNWASGQKTGTTLLTSVAFKPPLTAADFKP